MSGRIPKRPTAGKFVGIGRLTNSSEQIDPDVDLTVRWSSGYARMVQLLKNEYQLSPPQISIILGLPYKVVLEYSNLKANPKTTELEKRILNNLPHYLAADVLEEIKKSEATAEQMTRRCVALLAEIEKLRKNQEEIREAFRSPISIKLEKQGVPEKTAEQIEKEVRRELRTLQKEQVLTGVTRNTTGS